MKSILHTERNHYDRLVHFSFGLLLSYPQREILMRKAGLQGYWLNTMPIFTTLALSAIYEMIEAAVAGIVDPTDAAAFLGWQGDQWDSQEDMFMALAAAVICAIVMMVVTRRRTTSQTTAKAR